MTAISTALLMVGPSGVGPFHSPDWRVSFVAQLVEAGSNGPYWLINSPGQRESYLPINSIEPEEVARSVVLLLGQQFVDDAQVQGFLRETHNLIDNEDGTTTIAPYWDGSDSDFAYYASRQAPRCRLGVVKLDEMSLMNEGTFAHLLDYGFTLEAFESAGFSAIR